VGGEGRRDERGSAGDAGAAGSREWVWARWGAVWGRKRYLGVGGAGRGPSGGWKGMRGGGEAVVGGGGWLGGCRW